MAEPTFPLVMPNTPNFIRSEWGIARAVAQSQSPFTYSTQVHKFTGSKWYSTVTLPPMNRSQASEWQSFFMQLHGSFGTFLMGDPDAIALGVQGTISNTVAVNADFAVGAYDVTIDGADASESQLFKKGDYVQFNSGATSKLHMIIADVASNGSGVATLTIEPSLSAALSNNATVTYASPKCVMRMTNNELTWSANHISLYGVSFSCEEVL
tara:strand:+ start:767 stop:1399 length:633 start_codon:yes stop_codon:yes gene_type:complete